MPTLAALLPVLTVLGLLLAGRSSLRAAVWGLAVALGVAGWQAWVGTSDVPASAWRAAAVYWLPVVAEVVFIIGGGLALSQLLQARGAQAALAVWLEQRAGRGAGAVLLVVHGVTPFAESVTGFGIGVTLGIPLLLHLGLAPARAAAVGLLGLCAVPWGSMGPGTLVAARMAGLPVDALGVASAVFSGVPFLVAGWAAVWLAGPSAARGRDLALATASALVLWGSVWAANTLVGTPPAGALGALLTALFHLLLRRGAWPALPAPAWVALRAYALLLGGVLLSALAVRLAGGWPYLASPALWLWVAALLAARGSAWRAPMAQALRGWGVVAPVALAYIALGLVMSVTQLAAQLAEALAGLGSGYALAAPFVAALGGFITGSNTGANAMLADTQARIAAQIGAPALPFMAIHNVCAALLLMASPAKVEMALQLCPPAALQARAWVQRTVLLAALASVLVLALVNMAMQPG
ncbi:MAG: L-lactate permease [Pseudomonadota bacterium]|nr:L-lactate permease [Pseudomonadota bacterium]